MTQLPGEIVSEPSIPDGWVRRPGLLPPPPPTTDPWYKLPPDAQVALAGKNVASLELWFNDAGERLTTPATMGVHLFELLVARGACSYPDAVRLGCEFAVMMVDVPQGRP